MDLLKTLFGKENQHVFVEQEAMVAVVHGTGYGQEWSDSRVLCAHMSGLLYKIPLHF